MRRFGGGTVLIALLLGTWAGISFAGPYTNGDVFLSLRNGTVREYQPDGTLVQTLNTGTGGELTGSTFDSSGNFYVTAGFSPFLSGNTYKFDTLGNSLGAYFTNSGGSSVESILFNKAGKALVGTADGDQSVKLYAATGGNPSQTYPVATEDRGSDWIDLASDQNTLYYTSEGTKIFRYDLSTSTQLPVFTSNGVAGETLFAFRLLSGGGIIAADSDRVLRFDSSGNVDNTYLLGATQLFGLNIAPGGTSFWTAEYSTGDVYNVDIASGTVLHHFDINTGISGVSVLGEITVGGPGPGTPVPEPGTMMLLGSGLVGLVAYGRKKFRK